MKNKGSLLLMLEKERRNAENKGGFAQCVDFSLFCIGVV